MDRLLEPFLGFFHCAGEEFQNEEYDDAVMMEVVTPTTSMGTITSNPTLYSMPSKESLVEVRQDTMYRYRTSPLFAGTASVPISFEEHRDDSMRSTSSRLDEVRQSLSLTPPRKVVPMTASPGKKSSQTTPPRNSLILS